MRSSSLRWTEFAVREARQTLRLWEQRIGTLRPPIAVEDLADLLCLLAIDVTFDLPSNLAGRLYPEQRIIEVRRSDSPRRQRFTIAHEVGHYRLHVATAQTPTSTYACSERAISSGFGESTHSQLHEATLPGFTVPTAPAETKPSTHSARQYEIEANTFAAELLMPAVMIEQAVERYGKDIPALAEHFDVSQQAMRYRLEKLMLIPRPGLQTSFLADL